MKTAGSKPVCVHLHDTRGMGIANASAALDAGARMLDGSLGGLGGCPFAPGATGNVVFEDLVFLCESKGFATGIDIEKLVAVRVDPEIGNAGRVALWRAARGLPGRTAGLRQRVRAMRPALIVAAQPSGIAARSSGAFSSREPAPTSLENALGQR